MLAALERTSSRSVAGRCRRKGPCARESVEEMRERGMCVRVLRRKCVAGVRVGGRGVVDEVDVEAKVEDESWVDAEFEVDIDSALRGGGSEEESMVDSARGVQPLHAQIENNNLA